MGFVKEHACSASLTLKQGFPTMLRFVNSKRLLLHEDTFYERIFLFRREFSSIGFTGWPCIDFNRPCIVFLLFENSICSQKQHIEIGCDSVVGFTF